MQLSHYYSLINQVAILKNNGKLSTNLKNHYLKEMKKRLPAIIKARKSHISYFKNLISLSGSNKTTTKVWSQIFPAYISFLTLGKGERFLK